MPRHKSGIEAFKVYLIGRQFEIHTDHNALVWLDRLEENSLNNQRLTHWSLSLQPYSFVVKHCKGQMNKNADALSQCAPN